MEQRHDSGETGSPRAASEAGDCPRSGAGAVSPHGRAARPAVDFLPLSILGYGLHIALVCLVGWPGSSSVFTAGLTADDPLSPFMFAKNLAFCLAFLAWFAIAMRGGRRFYELFARPLTWWLFSALLACAGGGVLVAGTSATGPTPALEALCGALMGVAVSGNFTLWQRTLCSRPTPVDARGLVGGTVLGGFLFFLTAWLPSSAVRIVALAVMTPGTALALMLCNMPAVTGASDVPVLSVTPSDTAARRSALRKGLLALVMPCVTIGSIGFVMQAMRITFVGQGMQEALIGNLYSVANILGPALLMLWFERNRYHVDMGVFYRVAAPLIGVVALLLPLTGPAFQHGASVLMYAVFSVASIMAILACNQVSRRYQVPPIALYALCFGIIYLTRFAPTVIWSPLVAGTPSAGPVALTSLALMFGCYVASDRFQRRQDAAQVWSWESELPLDERQARTPEDAVRELGSQRGLTAREAEVLALMCTGRGVPAIAEKMGVSANTVRFHAKNLYAKLDVHSRQELAELVDAQLVDAQSTKE